MLIVIVIIGILIAALLPRMQGAQGRARDVSRTSHLSQIATAIISYQSDKWEWPTGTVTGAAAQGMKVADIANDLLKSGISEVPWDPNKLNEVSGLNSKSVSGDYLYMVTKKNWSANNGFILMAHTETEWSSNRVVCDSGSGNIAAGTDISDIQLCPKVSKGACSGCTYAQTSELRYVYMY